MLSDRLRKKCWVNGGVGGRAGDSVGCSLEFSHKLAEQGSSLPQATGMGFPSSCDSDFCDQLAPEPPSLLGDQGTGLPSKDELTRDLVLGCPPPLHPGLALVSGTTAKFWYRPPTPAGSTGQPRL